MSSLNTSPTQLLTPPENRLSHSFEVNFISDPDEQMQQALAILQSDWDSVDLLPYRTAFIVTDTDGLEDYLDATEWADTGMSLLASQAGGSMSFNGQGKYVSNAQTMISESIHLIESFYPSFEAQMRALPAISQFLKDLQRQRHQEAVAIQLNSKLIFLS